MALTEKQKAYLRHNLEAGFDGPLTGELHMKLPISEVRLDPVSGHFEIGFEDGSSWIYPDTASVEEALVECAEVAQQAFAESKK